MAIKEHTYTIDLTPSIIKKALYWSGNFNYVSYLNPNNISFPYGSFLHVLAVSDNCIKIDYANTFDTLKKTISDSNDWLFGYLGYDLKNQIEDLSSNNHDRIKLNDSQFFRPKHLLFFGVNEIKIISNSPDSIYHEIFETELPVKNEISEIITQASMSKAEYLEKVDEIRNNIKNGDVYEMNFCMEFFSEQVDIDPVYYYLELCNQSPMPFSGYQKWGTTYLMCASPERFLKKKGDKIISQPIKGTIKRGLTIEEDNALKEFLRNDEKEIAENMMIVDLVRNDLAKTSVTGSIQVEEFFGIYTFEHVHQMISTVTSIRNDDVHFIDVIKQAFPMGSMTGAPKIRSMQLIELYENTKRGLYSGSIGYFEPNGDFDFNVVIRSLLYNQESNKISFQVGSAITYDSIPEKEYEECLLKAKAIKKLLKGTLL